MLRLTGREKIEAILHREPVDRLAWTSLVDAATLDGLPENMHGITGIDFYKQLGCDILLLNCWGMPYDFASPARVWPDWVDETISREGDRHSQCLKTPEGTLCWVQFQGHPTGFPVNTIEDVELYREIWAGARFETRDDCPVHAKIDTEIGVDGIVTRFWGPSTIPMLLEMDMGMSNFYMMMCEYPERMEALIQTIHEKQIQAFEILAHGPCEVVILCENTSTMYITPDIYRKFNGPHVKDFVDIAHAAGKLAIIHMCGHVRDLLPLIRQTGLDGVHALTPPPTGNTPWELYLDEIGDDQIVIGALDPTVFVSGPLERIPAALDELYTPRLRRSNFILSAFADGIPVPWERFQAVAAWMEKNGKNT